MDAILNDRLVNKLVEIVILIVFVWVINRTEKK